jgi:hypothetical protein
VHITRRVSLQPNYADRVLRYDSRAKGTAHDIGHLMLSVEKIGDQIELIVADNGVGMKDVAMQ